MNKNYASVDLVKFFMSIVVIAIHTRPFSNISNTAFINIYDMITKVAVPFFFISSGFFMYTPIYEEYKKRIVKTIIKMTRLYTIWTLLYLPITVYGYIRRDLGFVKSIQEFFRSVFFIGENQNSWILWYLLSSIYALILIYIMIYMLKLKDNMCLMMAILFYIIHIFLPMIYRMEFLPQEMNQLVETCMYIMPNPRMLTSMVYIYGGLLLAKKTEQSFVGIFKGIFILFVGVTILNNIESYEYSKIVTPIISMGLFVIVKNTKIKQIKYSKTFRKMSTVIYLLHMYIFTIYSLIRGDIFEVFGMVSFIVVLLSSAIASFFILQISKYSKIIKYCIE